MSNVETVKIEGEVNHPIVGDMNSNVVMISADNLTEESNSGLDIESVEDLKEQMEEDAPGEKVTDNEKVITQETVITDELTEKRLAELEGLNFIELLKAKRELNDQIKSLDNTKETAENLLNLSKSFAGDPSLTDSIEMANLQSEVNYDEISAFLAGYEKSHANLERTITRVEELLKEFDSIPKTTTYLTNQMIDIINKNIKKIEKMDLTPGRRKEMNIYYKVQKEILDNRDNLDWIISKVPEKKILVNRLMASLKKDKTKSKSTLISVQNNVVKAFCSVFSPQQMQAFENYLKELYQDENVSFYTQYIIYLIFKQEKESGKFGKHKWVETLIMNVLDIATDSYDIESGKDAYNEQLLALGEAVKTIIKKR